jgi:hypothetical protein
MTNGAVAAGAAAAAARRRAEEEELRTMTYSADELALGWEFKILRAPTRMFRKREVLASILAEEARAGWELLEKLDDARLRLKRPVALRERDAALDFDPYRTQCGIGEGTLALLVVVSILGLLALVIAVVALVKGS